jgi:lysophospholipase L1-like esterase
VNTTKSYFLQSFLIVFLAAFFFIGIKDFLPKKIFSDKAGTTKNILIDSMMIDALKQEKDSSGLAVDGDSLANQPISFFENNGVTFPEETFENYSGYQYLIPFYENLFQLETSKTDNVRIAYFGDSMTDGDLIVQDLRSEFQNRFGGEGVGFVSITSESAASRGSITHQYSENWKTQSYLNVKNPIRSFGVNGHVFFAKDTINKTWIRFKASNLKNISQLNNPTLFYGSSDNKDGQIDYKIGKDTLHTKLLANNLLNTINLAAYNLKSLKVDFKNARRVPIYGFNFDDGKGVHVDNFSQRGNSGMPISKFDIDLMQAFQKKLNYDMIVLHYGTNVLGYGTLDFSWYDKNMTKTVNRLKLCFPGVPILIISTADKSTKYDLEMKTDSAVVPLSTSQKKYALKTQSGFINLYTLMGGNGSMTKWVEADESLANKDYTHFNFRGSKKIAKMLFDKINIGFEQYKILRKNRVLDPIGIPITTDSSANSKNPNE